MKKPLIIGLTGLAGSGKDTARAALEDLGFTGLAFADGLRNMIYMLLDSYGVNKDYMNCRELKETIIPGWGVSYRHLMQTLGTEWGRGALGVPDFWVARMGQLLDENYSRLPGEVMGVVISDVRFDNEADLVKSRGGVIWRITRCGVDPVRGHVSESEMEHIKADLTITNNGTVLELRRAVQRAAKAALK